MDQAVQFNRFHEAPVYPLAITPHTATQTGKA